jgi:hypothetical protein
LYNDDITISGGCYFALTPSCAMGGGGLEILFSSHGLKAWFTAHANLIVYWHPFFFIGDIDISVGASYRLNLLFTSVNLSVELGASLKLWGPPIGGEVHVHWWVIGFTIGFGPDINNQTQPIGWDEFANLVVKKKETKLLKRFQEEKPPSLIKIIIERGLIPRPSASQKSKLLQQGKEYSKLFSSNEDSDDTWEVRSGNFRFRTEVSVPVTQLVYNGSKTVSGLSGSFNIKPMAVIGATSSHTIAVTFLNDKGQEEPVLNWIPVTTYINQNRTEKNGLISRSLPSALWGVRSDSEYANYDDMKQTPINHSVGISLDVPLPDYGTTLDKINLEDLSSAPVDPIGNVPVIAERTTYNPQVERDSIEKIAKEIATDPKVQKRNELIKMMSLTGMGSFGQSKMDRLATKAHNIYSEPPLVMTK